MKAVINNGNVKVVESTPKASMQVDVYKIAMQIRQRRNKMLFDTDWTQLVDAPLSEEEKSAYRGYRQDLRDITKQEGFPLNVVWPEPPI
jgi:predicted nuclease with RNAse H fold